MADNSYFHQDVTFSTRNLEYDEVPKRCTVCQLNPALLAYQKHVDLHSVNEENGYCCTACAFNMLLQLGNEEARKWAALGSI